MASSLTPTLTQIIAMRRWAPALCLGFAADADTILLESRVASTLELWQISLARFRGALDARRYVSCGTLPGYRGFILLEQGATISQLHHWDVDGSLTAIMAPLPTGRRLDLLPGGVRGIFADQQWQRMLISLPTGNLMAPLPEFGLNFAATNHLLAYVVGTAVHIWSCDQGKLLQSLPIPHGDVAMQYACHLDEPGHNLLVEGRRDAELVLWHWDISAVLAGGPTPPVRRIFASDHSDPFGIPAIGTDDSTIIVPTEDPLAAIPGRAAWERWDLSTGRAPACPQPQWPFRNVYVAPDGRTHLFYDATGRICFWLATEPADTLTPPIVAHEDADQTRLGFASARWSPDSRWLVTSGTNRRDTLASLGREPDDDAQVSEATKNDPEIPSHWLTDYVYATKLWRVRP